MNKITLYNHKRTPLLEIADKIVEVEDRKVKWVLDFSASRNHWRKYKIVIEVAGE